MTKLYTLIESGCCVGKRLKLLCEFGHSFEEICDDAVVGHLEDGSLRVFVDGYDGLGVFHAGQVLNSSGYTHGDVQLLSEQNCC